MCCVCMHVCVHSLIASDWDKVAWQLEHMTVSRGDQGVESAWCCFNTSTHNLFDPTLVVFWKRH